eukprot:570831_1
MAASSNRNESYIIEDILMTLATWYSSFLYQILMDRYDSITSCTVTIHSTTKPHHHNHDTDHNHQETQHTMTIRSTTQYTQTMDSCRTPSSHKPTTIQHILISMQQTHRSNDQWL